MGCLEGYVLRLEHISTIPGNVELVTSSFLEAGSCIHFYSFI
jgi:hypothetical protein